VGGWVARRKFPILHWSPAEQQLPWTISTVQAARYLVLCAAAAWMGWVAALWLLMTNQDLLDSLL
jgi:hypothetical protein